MAVCWEIFKRFNIFSILPIVVLITGCLQKSGNFPSASLRSSIQLINDTIQLNLLVDEINNQLSPDSVIYYSDLLINNAQKCKNELYLAKGYFYKATGLKMNSQYTAALSNILICINSAKAQKNDFLAAAAMNEMGNIYAGQKNHDEAIKSYRKSINQIGVDNGTAILIAAYNNLAGEYIEIQKLDSALNYYNESNRLSLLNGDSISAAYAKGNSGGILAKQNNLDSACVCLTSACDFLKNTQSYGADLGFKVWLSYVYIKKKQYPQAIDHANEAIKLAIRYDQKVTICDAYEQLAEIYEKTEQFPKANFALKQYYAYRDSIVNTETITQMANLRTEFEVGQKQAELDAMAENERFKTLIAWILLVALSSVAVLLVIVYRHYSRNKRLVVLLNDQKGELELANATKDRFFSVISHDLRGPIGAIGNLVMLANDAMIEDQTTELRKLLTMMGDNSREVETLLNNLLHWSVGQRGAYQKHNAEVDFTHLVNNVISIYKPIAFAKGIQLAFVPHAEAHSVVTDPNSWAVIVRNLVNNAIKFTHTGGEVAITTCQHENRLVLKVSDTGIGMEAGAVENLFKSAVNQPQWGTNYEKGMGIGLSLVKDFVDINSGTIEVSSVYGEGTVFSVAIPVGAAMYSQQAIELN